MINEIIYKNTIILRNPFALKTTDIPEQYTWFVDKLSDIFKDNLEMFSHNAKSLVIYKGITKEHLKLSASGLYDYKNNKIYVKNDQQKSHELFHCSSSYFDGVNEFGGFYQKNAITEIGVSLDEGYTALLDKRYFDVDSSEEYIQMKHAKLIEDIIGKDKMEILYSHADLYELVQELNRYSSLKSIINMLYEMDTLYSYKESLKDTHNLDIINSISYHNSIILNEIENIKNYKEKKLKKSNKKYAFSK